MHRTLSSEISDKNSLLSTAHRLKLITLNLTAGCYILVRELSSTKRRKALVQRLSFLKDLKTDKFLGSFICFSNPPDFYDFYSSSSCNSKCSNCYGITTNSVPSF